MKQMKAITLTAQGYQNYGSVISARDDLPSTPANMGTAKRFNYLAEIENLRPGSAKANLCLFHCTPLIVAPQNSFEVKLLERHPHSTQTFIPMGGSERYLVIVCEGGDTPDLSTLGAFVADKHQGISYKAGMWHHPLIAMDVPTDFTCLVWEDQSKGDCDIFKLAEPVTIQI